MGGAGIKGCPTTRGDFDQQDLIRKSEARHRTAIIYFLPLRNMSTLISDNCRKDKLGEDPYRFLR